MVANIFCTFLCLISLTGFCQGTFIRAYYTADANAFEEAASYGRVCARTSAGYIQGTIDGELIWMDHNGEVVNTIQVLQTNALSNYFTFDEIAVAPNDDFYTFINTGNDSLMVLKMDFSGNILWQKYIADFSSMSGAVAGMNGEITFSYRTYGGGSILQDNVIIKLASDGSVLWENRFDHVGSMPSRVTINGLTRASDGGILAGGISIVNSQAKPLMLKVDLQGEVEWAYTFSQTNGNNASIDFVQELNDGNVLAIVNAADVTAKCATIKISESGQVLESRGFVIENSLSAARIEPDGGFQAAILNSDGCFSVSATGEIEYGNYYLRPINEVVGFLTSFDNILQSSGGSIEYYGTRFYPFGPGHSVLIRTYPNGDVEEGFFQEMSVTTTDYATEATPIAIQTLDTIVSAPSSDWFTQDHALALDSLFTNPQLLQVLEKKSHDISLWPNPAESIVQWQSDKDIDQIVVYDSQGKMILVHNTMNNFIPIADLKNGLYYLVFVRGKELIATKSFIKQ